MGLTSLQVCMDSSDHWLQGTMSEDNTGMDHSSPPSGEDMLTCSRPLIERRLRPPHEQSLKCPRCESTHTKFCYYNNYSLSQPRYFCKTCRRYWTKGGTLRNIPVGGGCRKNKKQSSNSKKPSNESSPTSSSLILSQQNNTGFSYHNHNNINNIQTDLHLSFPEMHFSALHAANLFNTHGANTNPNFMLENHAPIEFMDNKYESLVGGTSHDFMGNNNGENFNGLMGAHNNNFPAGNICSSFGMTSFDHGSSANVLDNCQRLMLPYENHHQNFEQNNHNLDDVKPNPKILSLEWHDHLQQQACNSDAGKESFGYTNFGGLGSWTGLMNGYGSSATNPLV